MMNPKQMENAQKVVMAGMKLLYAPEARKLLNQAVSAIKSKGPDALAVNAVGIIKILFDKSGGKMPPDVIPLATILMIYELATFASEATGEKIPAEEVQKAVPVAMDMLKKVFAEQIKGGGKTQPQAQPQQPMPPQGGLIQQPQMMGA